MNRGPHRDMERLEDEIAAYALGALTEREAAELERHLAGCESCRERLRWFEPAVGVLPATVEQRTPPPSLRERLMATVREEAAAEPGPAPSTASAGAREPWWRSLRAFALRPAVGMAAAIVLVVGVGLGYALRGDDSPTTTTEPAIALTSKPVSAALEHDGASGTLHVSEMPPLKAGRVYEVWVERDGALEPRSTFVLSMDGSAEAAVDDLAGGSAVYVTDEPDGGSVQPTTDPLLEVQL